MNRERPDRAPFEAGGDETVLYGEDGMAVEKEAFRAFLYGGFGYNSCPRRLIAME